MEETRKQTELRNQAEVRGRDADIDRLSKEIQKVKLVSSEMRDIETLNREQISKLRHEKEHFRRLLLETSTSLTNEQTQSQQLKNKLTMKNKEYSKLKHKYKALTETSNALELKVETKDEIIAQKEKEQTETFHLLEEARSEIVSLHSMNESNTLRAKALESNLTEARESITGLVDEITTLQSANQRLLEQLGDRQQENNVDIEPEEEEFPIPDESIAELSLLKTQYQALQAQQRRTRQESGHEKKLVAIVKKELEKLRETHAQCDPEIAILKRRLDISTHKGEQHVNTIEAQMLQISRLESKIHTQTYQLNHYKRKENAAQVLQDEREHNFDVSGQDDSSSVWGGDARSQDARSGTGRTYGAPGTSKLSNNPLES